MTSQDRDTKRSDRLQFRCTPGQHHALTRIIQQRHLPEIETTSDACLAGLMLFFEYARLKRQGTDQKQLGLLILDSEVTARAEFRERMTLTLLHLEEELTETKREKWDSHFLKAYEAIERIRDDVDDPKVRTEANKLWVKWKLDAIALKKKP